MVGKVCSDIWLETWFLIWISKLIAAAGTCVRNQECHTALHRCVSRVQVSYANTSAIFEGFLSNEFYVTVVACM